MGVRKTGAASEWNPTHADTRRGVFLEPEPSGGGEDDGEGDGAAWTGADLVGCELGAGAGVSSSAGRDSVMEMGGFDDRVFLVVSFPRSLSGEERTPT